MILILCATPFLFYLYQYAPGGSKTWDIGVLKLHSGNFNSMQLFIHAAFTKITFLLITTLWFFSSQRWWKYAILVPFTMFLYQFGGVVNFSTPVIDEYDFLSALPIIIPIVIIMIVISLKLKLKIERLDLRDEIEEEINKISNNEK